MWLLVVAVIGFGFYCSRVIQPTAVAVGEQPITPAQRRWFAVGVFLLWVASDWPVHDVGEKRLYMVHMAQHMILTVMLPPAFLLAMPEWLARYLLGEGRVYLWAKRLAGPFVATIGYNVMAAGSHWPAVVNLAIDNGPFHYAVHAILVVTSFMIWIPVVGPIPEFRLGPVGRMLLVFTMSLIPTVPVAFLTAAENPIYQSYNHDPRLWGISVVADQQLAGAVMKILEGIYLWVLILTMLLRWYESDSRGKKFRGKLVTSTSAVTESGDTTVPVNQPVSDGERGDSAVPAEQPSGSNR